MVLYIFPNVNKSHEKPATLNIHYCTKSAAEKNTNLSSNLLKMLPLLFWELQSIYENRIIYCI